jgi:hypothetical protein
MRWTSVALAGCLLPVVTGCGVARNLATEVRLAREQCGVGHDVRKDARAAWLCVRAQHPRRAFAAEFRDGFIDGYAAFFEHGAAAEAPAVPPVGYARYRKYLGADGHCLVRDYYLGFQYGADVAAAAGRHVHLAVPPPPGDPRAGDAPPPAGPMKPPAPVPPEAYPIPAPRPVPGGKKSDDPPPLLLPPENRGPLPTSPGPTAGDEENGQAVPRLPKPELPVIKPFNPDLTGGGKFAPLPVPPDPDLLPVPNPPLPMTEPRLRPLPVPADGPGVTIPPAPGSPAVPVPVMKFVLPPPLDAVPTLPASALTPLVLQDIPPIPFRHPDLTPVGGLIPRK